MISRANIQYFDKLKVGILSNEDIFLTKAVALNKNSLQNLIKILKAGSFDWNLLWNEIMKQEHDRNINITSSILDYTYDIMNEGFVHVPIYNELLIRATDQEIIRGIKIRPTSVREIVQYIKHDDITERIIAERIDCLEAEGKLRKEERNNTTFVMSS